MSILIKGMDMPNDCSNCPFKVSNGIISGRRMEFECVANGYVTLDDYQYDDKPSNCPLVEIPTPHGRLIEEHYSGELQAKQPEGVFIIYRSADKDTDRFILEAEE